MYKRLLFAGSGLVPVIQAKEKESTPTTPAKGSGTPCCHGKKTVQEEKLIKQSKLGPKLQKKSWPGVLLLWNSVYELPFPKVEYEIVNIEPGTLEKCIRTTRQTVSTYLGSFQEAHDRLSGFINTGVEHTKSTYDYLTDDASTVPRVIAITVGGFSGLVLAVRRGFFKKLLYGSTGALVVAAVCYPKEAKEMSKTALHKIRTDGFELVQQYTGYHPEDLTKKLPELPTTETFSSIIELFNKKIRGVEKPEVEGDPGQSNPADKHMYTTRGN